jgi:putative flavoprotein involved in K+ transport
VTRRQEIKMTETATASGEVTSEEQVDAWLADFNAALDAKDAAGAAELVATASFWRDLISLTWNITTVEGPDGVRDMLEHTLLMLFADDVVRDRFGAG